MLSFFSRSSVYAACTQFTEIVGEVPGTGAGGALTRGRAACAGAWRLSRLVLLVSQCLLLPVTWTVWEGGRDAASPVTLPGPGEEAGTGPGAHVTTHGFCQTRTVL